MQICPKIKNRQGQLRLSFRCKCDWKFLLKNTTHHVIMCGVSLQSDLSAVINTGWAKKKIKTVPHSAKSISIIDMIETRTIWTTSLSQNLLVLTKQKRVFTLLELFLTVVVFMSTFKTKKNSWGSNCAKT